MSLPQTPPRHPAKYSDALFPVFAKIIETYQITESILDPMAGVGKIGLLKDYGFEGRIVANEIEPEWALQAPEYVEVHVGDAAKMTWAKDEEFEAIIVSPVYGNRMSDNFVPKAESKPRRRYTYRLALGRQLNEANTGKLQWGPKYQEAHARIWAECVRVLRPDGYMVVNVKNFYRNKKIVYASEWHASELARQGLILVDKYEVACPGMRHGANSELRVEFEDVWVFQKP